jgi:large subunit ribosomal protein L13
MYTQKSHVLKPAEADKKWLVIDATDKVVGRLATDGADLLMGWDDKYVEVPFKAVQ